MRTKKICAKMAFRAVAAGSFLAAFICGYGWHRCAIEKDKLLAENIKQKKQMDDYEEEIAGYIQRLAEYERVEEEKVEWLENGFSKQGGVYLIGKSEQMYELAELVAFGSQIEPGIVAAKADYRLVNDLELDDWFRLGSKSMPFRGSLDGDGHTISGLFMSQSETGAECFLVSDGKARTENLIVENGMKENSEVRIDISSDEGSKEIREAIGVLRTFPQCSIKFRIEDYYVDTSVLAEDLTEHWARKEEGAGQFISVNFLPEHGCEGKNAVSMKPFAGLFGEEGGRIVEAVLEKEESFLAFIRLEQIEGLECCTFAVHGKEDEEHHLLLRGQWEGKEVDLQHFVIPHAEYGKTYHNYYIEREDVNFDGKGDLLIHETSSWGSGGSFGEYRAITWEADKSRFVYYPSFPEVLNVLEFDRGRVLCRGRLGWEQEIVEEYRVVNGIYEETRRLELKRTSPEDSTAGVLYYYEMGKLIRAHNLTRGTEEASELYPDLSYWSKG